MSAVRQLSMALGLKQERYFEESFDGAVLDEPIVTPAAAGTAESEAFKVTFRSRPSWSTCAAISSYWQQFARPVCGFLHPAATR